MLALVASNNYGLELPIEDCGFYCEESSYTKNTRMGFIDSEEVCKLYAKCIQNSVCVCVFVESRCTVFHVCDTIMVVSTKIQQCED